MDKGRSKVVGLQVRISASSNEVSSVRLKPGSQGWYEGISMNDWMKKWCVFYDSHWVTFVFAIQSAWIVSKGKDYNAWLRFRKLFHTKEESTKEFEARRWQLLDLDHAEPLSIQKKDWRRLIGQKCSHKFIIIIILILPGNTELESPCGVRSDVQKEDVLMLIHTWHVKWFLSYLQFTSIDTRYIKYY